MGTIAKLARITQIRNELEPEQKIGNQISRYGPDHMIMLCSTI